MPPKEKELVMANKKDSAFARPAYVSSSGNTFSPPQEGLTKREYFAALALQGMLAYHNRPDADGWDRIAKESVAAADALLEKLKEIE